MRVRKKTDLKASVDKRRITFFDKRFYGGSVELLGELVNNASDREAGAREPDGQGGLT